MKGFKLWILVKSMKYLVGLICQLQVFPGATSQASVHGNLITYLPENSHNNPLILSWYHIESERTNFDWFKVEANSKDV